MKIRSIAVSQAIRLYKADRRTEDRVYIGDLVKGLAARYKFLEVPKTLREHDIKTGVTFLHGIYKKNIIIDKVQIFPDGVVCESKTDSENCDEFLDEALEWASKEFKFSLEELENSNRIYLSTLEIESEVNINLVFTKFNEIGKSLTAFLKSYGQEVPIFEGSHIAMHCDTSKLSGIKPTLFSFERRTEHPYDSGVYFSSAPLKTADHLKILNELEKILAH